MEPIIERLLASDEPSSGGARCADRHRSMVERRVKMPVNIRRLQPGDEALAMEAVNVVKREDEPAIPLVTAAIMTAFLANPQNYLLAAVVDDRVVAFATAYRLDRLERHAAMLCVYEISVLSTHRRQHIGTALIEALKHLCLEQGFLKMWLLTNAENTAAMALYTSTGGEQGAGETVSFWWGFAG